MSHGPRAKLRNLVPHPRYGSAVIPSGNRIEGDAVRASFWRYRLDTIFPESALPADTAKQKYAVYPRRYYVDTLKECRKCSRRFLFFAREQQHWYERLGFWIDADCVLCPECRVSDQRLRRHFRRYSERIDRRDLTDREFQTLLADALFLAQCGVIKNKQRLFHLRKVARQRMPSSEALAALSAFLEQRQVVV
jgi:putative zinc ribbon protein